MTREAAAQPCVKYLAVFLLACSSSPTTPDAPKPIDAPAHLDAPHQSCQWTPGLFACGDTKSCNRETDFCVLGDPVFGASCKSIGGDGSTCPRCSTILPIVQQNGTCGSGSTPTCSGDETTGITIHCS